MNSNQWGLNQFLACMLACCIRMYYNFFKLFLKQTHVVTNNMDNCLTDNSSVGFR
jgi:hypothetical protein